MSETNDTKGPAVKIPPPVVFFGFMLIAIFIQRSYPILLPRFVFLEIVGALIMLAGVVVGIFALLGFRRVGTHVEPWKPSSAIVDDGVFSFSRNPMYVGMSMLVIGFGLFQGNAWVLLSVIPATVTIYFVAIKKEEAYLERKFGDDYLAYKKRVRRWL
jgi:protein-S-isoprenylcysteine O-methyltransferase Ste14